MAARGRRSTNQLVGGSLGLFWPPELPSSSQPLLHSVSNELPGLSVSFSPPLEVATANTDCVSIHTHPNECLVFTEPRADRLCFARTISLRVNG